MKLSKLLFTTLGVSVLLGALVGGANARILSSSSQTWRATFRTVTFNGVFGNIRCSLSLEGSFNARTIGKTAVSILYGHVNSANLGPCATGTATILRATLPWHVGFYRYFGTLPNVTVIGLIIRTFSIRIREPFATCLATSSNESPAVLNLNRELGGAVATAELGGTIPTSCGATGSFESSRDPFTVSGSATRITITLI